MMGWFGSMHGWLHVLYCTYPVHETNISQHEKVDLEQQSSLRRRIRRHAPNSDAKAMQETHLAQQAKASLRGVVQWARVFCRSVVVFQPTTKARKSCL